MRQKVRLIRPGIPVPFAIEAGADGPAMSGMMLPMAPKEVEELRAAVRNSPSAVETKAAAFAKRVVSWDVEDGDCRKAADIAALPEYFLGALESHITGYAFSPAQAADEKKSASPPV
jgi:hypothetical protein